MRISLIVEHLSASHLILLRARLAFAHILVMVPGNESTVYIWERVIHMHMCVHGHGRGWLASASHCACSSILSCGELIVNGAEGLASNMEPEHSVMHITGIHVSVYNSQTLMRSSVRGISLRTLHNTIQ